MATDREWIEEFTAAYPLHREFVIRERSDDIGRHYELFQTYPEPLVMAALTLDEVIGYFAITIVRDTCPTVGKTPDQEREWIAKYGRWGSHATAEKPPLEAWQKQLPERAGA